MKLLYLPLFGAIFSLVVATISIFALRKKPPVDNRNRIRIMIATIILVVLAIIMIILIVKT